MNRQQLKNSIKYSIKRLLAGIGRVDSAPGARILTYHSIGYRKNETNVHPQEFKIQLNFLSELFPILTLDDVLVGKNGIAITLDDGYADNLYYAAPILKELHIPATVFVVAGRMGEVLWKQDDPEHGRLLSANELLKLREYGVTIGSHGMTHRRLANLSEQEQRWEIQESIHQLSHILGESIYQFAYPYGTKWDYSPLTLQILRESGVKLAVTNRYGVNRENRNCLELRRIPIDSTDNQYFLQAKLTGQLDHLAWFESSLGLYLRKLLNKLTRS